MPDDSLDSRPPRDPIRVLVVDDHPALREGLDGLLRQEAGLLPVGALSGDGDLSQALDELRPDVIVLDYVLQRGVGLSLCFRFKQRSWPVGVVLYSACASPAFAVPATLAQADAVVAKDAPVDELVAAVHTVGGGRSRMPLLSLDEMAAASARLSADELPVAGMLFARVSTADIARTLDLPVEEVRRRAMCIIGKLQARDRLAEPAFR